MTLAKSPWIIHVNCNSCNGCDIEVVACLTPLYDAERFGILNIGTPKQADIMVVTGAVNYKNVNVLKNIYVIGGVDQVIPVDVYVPGCTPRPEAIIDGIVACLPILEEKKKKNIKGQEVKLKGSEVPSTDNLASTTG